MFFTYQNNVSTIYCIPYTGTTPAVFVQITQNMKTSKNTASWNISYVFYTSKTLSLLMIGSVESRVGQCQRNCIRIQFRVARIARNWSKYQSWRILLDRIDQVHKRPKRIVKPLNFQQQQFLITVAILDNKNIDQLTIQIFPGPILILIPTLILFLVWRILIGAFLFV